MVYDTYLREVWAVTWGGCMGCLRFGCYEFTVRGVFLLFNYCWGGQGSWRSNVHGARDPNASASRPSGDGGIRGAIISSLGFLYLGWAGSWGFKPLWGFGVRDGRQVPRVVYKITPGVCDT